MPKKRRPSDLPEPGFAVQKGEDVLLSILIKPNAKETRLLAVAPACLQISLAAPPIDGEANRELIRFLSQCLELGRGRFELVRGCKSREKVVLVREMRAATAEECLKMK